MELKKFLEMQKTLMKYLQIETEKAETYDDPRINSAILGLASEVGEVSQAINFSSRVWAQVSNEHAFNELGAEAIDVFFYLLELFILLGFDEADIERQYNLKYCKNISRIVAAQRT